MNLDGDTRSVDETREGISDEDLTTIPIINRRPEADPYRNIGRAAAQIVPPRKRDLAAVPLGLIKDAVAYIKAAKDDLVSDVKGALGSGIKTLKSNAALPVDIARTALDTTDSNTKTLLRIFGLTGLAALIGHEAISVLDESAEGVAPDKLTIGYRVALVSTMLSVVLATPNKWKKLKGLPGAIGLFRKALNDGGLKESTGLQDVDLATFNPGDWKNTRLVDGNPARSQLGLKAETVDPVDLIQMPIYRDVYQEESLAVQGLGEGAINATDATIEHFYPNENTAEVKYSLPGQSCILLEGKAVPVHAIYSIEGHSSSGTSKKVSKPVVYSLEGEDLSLENIQRYFDSDKNDATLMRVVYVDDQDTVVTEVDTAKKAYVILKPINGFVRLANEDRVGAREAIQDLLQEHFGRITKDEVVQVLTGSDALTADEIIKAIQDARPEGRKLDTWGRSKADRRDLGNIFYQLVLAGELKVDTSQDPTTFILKS